ncbi:helix-turn-helix transcriptional regulator [Streptomyces sp. NBC_00306]|uniref:helix-turn-helix transcriptional regulator n=1 Tax=Streptomyces sp. NBC_00306 TaxID=2975708 RepID=UPI002E288FE2|nr:helix-turn-helix transcriptional regulator [Streptomyces sp. NBC_00306]
MEPERDWERLGRSFAKAREAADLTQVDVAERIGVTRTPIQAIERGRAFKKVTGTMRSYARVLCWTDDSIDRVLAGGEPAPAAAAGEDGDATSRPVSVPGLPLAILDQLQGEGQLIDATVIPLPSRAGASMTIVVRGEPDASPEEIRDALLAWRKARRHLQDLGDEDAPAVSDG